MSKKGKWIAKGKNDRLATEMARLAYIKYILVWATRENRFMVRCRDGVYREQRRLNISPVLA